MSSVVKCVLEKHNIDVNEARLNKDLVEDRDRSVSKDDDYNYALCCVCTVEEGPILKCDHPICADCLLECTWKDAIELKVAPTCGSCSEDVDFVEVVKIGQPVRDEKDFLSTAYSINVCHQDGIQQCPGCQSYCERQDSSSLLVSCVVCNDFNFCWDCLGEWKNLQNTKACGNGNCKKQKKLNKIGQCPMVKFKGNWWWRSATVPKYRFCPKCNTVIDHDDGCNAMTCKRCFCQFCYICLKVGEDGKPGCKSESWANKLHCKPAKRQSILK